MFNRLYKMIFWRREVNKKLDSCIEHCNNIINTCDKIISK